MPRTPRRRSTSSSPAFPPPQWATSRNPDRPTLVDEVARWHLAVNRQHLMPHQRMIAELVTELDPATGHRWYDTVLLEVPRQNGKTNLLEALMLTASRRPDPDTGDLVRRTVVYTAQDREKARERLVVDLMEQKLETNRHLARFMKLRKSNGSERITWRDTGARIMLQASNDTAGHSLTIDDAVLDEAFAHKDLTLVNGLAPPMLTKIDPQLLVVSTKGQGDDGMLLHYEEVARISLNDPDTRVAVVVWEAGEDDDRYDPALWARVMPAFGRTAQAARVRSFLQTMPAEEFDRAFLNRRPTVATVAALDIAAWQDCANTGPELAPHGPVVLAVDVDPDRTHGELAVAWAHDDRVAVVIDRQPGTAWMTGAVLELVHRHGLTVYDVWGDRRAGVGGILDQLAGRGIPTHETSAGDVASAAGDMYDLVKARAMIHDAQPKLDEAVSGSRRRPLGEAWAFSKVESVGDVAPLTCATLAVAGYRHHFPAGLLATAGIR